MRRAHLRFALGIIATVLLLLLVSPLQAQRITGQIAGTVKDAEGGVLPGVAVTLAGEKIMGEQTTFTSASGNYRFIGLPPGSYDLSFQLEGFQPLTRTGVVAQVGVTARENASLSVGELTEAITVTAEAPIIDAESNVVGTNYDRHWVENAPVQRLSFNDLVAHAPGSLRGGDTSQRTMVYGSSYDENAFQLDGADVTDNFFNEQLAQPNIDIIEEIEVLSLGAAAEYGNLTGAVYNVVTRQGSNQFHGDFNFFIQDEDFDSTNTNEEQNEGFPWTRDEYNDYSFQIGGPIVKDKVWFFASYQRQENSRFATGADPSIPLAATTDEDDRYFGKLNVQINPSHKIQLTYHQDDTISTGGIGLDVTPSTATAREGTTPTPGISYTGILSSSTFIEARATGFFGDVFFGPKDPNQPRDLPRIIDFDTGVVSGGHYYWYDLQPERTTVNVKVSKFADDFAGDHDFRFGVQYNESEAGGVYGYNDLHLVYSLYNPDTNTYMRYGYGYTRVPFSYSGNTEAIGVFADDTWQVSDRLTLNLGVRYDKNDAFSRKQDELDANLQPTGTVFPRADHYTWEYVSPRIGLTYKLTEDGRTVLKFHVGRYHRAIATGEFANVIGPSIKPIFIGLVDQESLMIFDQSGDPESLKFIDLAEFSNNSRLFVDPNYDSPRQDQIYLTVERQFSDNIGGYITLVNKKGRDFGAWRDIGGIYEDVIWIDDETGNEIVLQQLQNDPEDRAFVITNRDEMDHDIYAATIGINRPMRNRWSLNASVTFLRSEGRTPDSAGGVSVQQRGGLQFRNFGRNPNDFVNTGGRLRGDVPWQFKTQFVYRFPKGVLAALSIQARDGANRIRRVRLPRSVTNLSTTILAVERGEFGRLPSQTLVDLRVEKDFKISGDVRIAIMADVFNVLNDDAPDSVRSSVGTSSVFNQETAFSLPRRVQLGFKLRF